MITYELEYGIDVLFESRLRMKQIINRRLTNESIDQDTEYVASFIDAANGYSISESEWVIDAHGYSPLNGRLHRISNI